jgi:hypothetical protein
MGCLPTASAAAAATATVSTAAATTITTAAATTIAAAATTITAAAAAATTLFAGLGFVDSQIASVEILTVEVFNGIHHGILGIHRDESKATGAVAFAIDRDMHICHCSEIAKKASEIIFIGIKGEIPHIHFHRF